MHALIYLFICLRLLLQIIFKPSDALKIDLYVIKDHDSLVELEVPGNNANLMTFPVNCVTLF